MTVLEMVAETMAYEELGATYRWQEIIDLVVNRHGVNPGSVIPSDYCYNLTNKDKERNPALKRFNILMNIGRGLYQYVGSDYDASAFQGPPLNR